MGTPHSALNPNARALIEDNVTYQINACSSELVLWRDIQAAPPAALTVSPLADIPQVGRRGRILVLDLSFAV